jgi:hypothetical protein
LSEESFICPLNFPLSLLFYNYFSRLPISLLLVLGVLLFIYLLFPWITFLWPFGHFWVMDFPFEASQSHSFTPTTFSRTSLDEWSAQRRNLLFYDHNLILHKVALYFPQIVSVTSGKVKMQLRFVENVVYIFINFHFPGDWRSWKGWRFSLRLLFALLPDVSWVSSSIYPNYLLQCRVLKLCLLSVLRPSRFNLINIKRLSSY